MFLHKHESFRDLIETLAFERQIPPAIVEKDYWVMHALWGLNECKFKYYFKGGTSLSKGFDIIKRFSEDIDLQIDPPEHLKVYLGKNHQTKKHQDSRKDFYEWVVATILIDGLTLSSHGAVDEKIRNYAIELAYDSYFSRDEIIKRHVLLEIGFARISPNEARTISSWSFDRATQAKLDIRDNRARSVNVYFPEYTFVEKLDAISRKYHNGKNPREWVRHYYDIYMLLKLPRVQSFIGTEPYKEYMNDRFSQNIDKHDSLRLIDVSRFDSLKKAHDAEIGLYFEPQPSFDDIIETIRIWAPKL